MASLPAWAGNGSGTIGNLPDILIANLNIIADIMQTLAILIGLALFVGGMFQLKRYGEMRTMMSSQMSIAGPLMTLIAGVAMLCAPLMIGTALVSFWGAGGANDLPYDGDDHGGLDSIYSAGIDAGAHCWCLCVDARLCDGGEDRQRPRAPGNQSESVWCIFLRVSSVCILWGQSN